MSEKDMVISERYLRNKLEDTEALLASAQRTIEAQAGILEALEAYGVSMPDKYYDLKEGKD